MTPPPVCVGRLSIFGFLSNGNRVRRVWPRTKTECGAQVQQVLRNIEGASRNDGITGVVAGIWI